MEEQDNSSTDVAIVEEKQIVRRGPYKKTKPKTTFLKPKGHDLDKAIKQSARYLETALRTLVEISVSKEAETKERRQAAESLLKLHKDMVGQRDKDEIERLTKEVEVLKLIGQGTTDDEEEENDDIPQLDFDNIHPDFRDNEPTDVEFKEKVDNSED